MEPHRSSGIVSASNSIQISLGNSAYGQAEFSELSAFRFKLNTLFSVKVIVVTT